jgi:hypothetical protein
MPPRTQRSSAGRKRERKATTAPAQQAPPGEAPCAQASTDLQWQFQQQLAQLLGGVVDSSMQHLREAGTDLDQTRLLLDEAVKRLTDCFFTLHAVIDAQQALVRQCADDTGEATAGAQLQQQAGVIARQIGAAITSLQFQDMTNQLLERAGRRLCGLRTMLGDTAAVASALRSKEDGCVVHLLIDAVTARLARQSETLDDALFKSVRQEHLASGDIELF